MAKKSDNEIVKSNGNALSNVEYVGWNDDDAREVKKQAEKDNDSVVFRKFPQGKTVLRVLPKLKGATWGVGSTPYLKVYQHGLKTTDDQFVATECTWRGRPATDRAPCPICEYASELSRSANPVDQGRAREFFAKPTLLFNAIIRDKDAEPEDYTVKLVQASAKSIVSGIEGLRNPPEDYDADDDKSVVFGDFSNPTDKGFDIVIRRKGEGMKTEYTVSASARRELGDELMHLIAEQHDPRKYTRMLPAAVMKALLDGIDMEDFKALLKKQAKSTRVDDDDEDDAPRSTRAKTPPRGRIVEDTEFDEDDED